MLISNAFILHFQDISHGGIWGSAKRDENHRSTRVTTDWAGHDITTRQYIKTLWQQKKWMVIVMLGITTN